MHHGGLRGSSGGDDSIESVTCEGTHDLTAMLAACNLLQCSLGLYQVKSTRGGKDGVAG